MSELIQRLAKVGAPGLVNFITTVAYQFCLNLPAAFMQPGPPTLANLYTKNWFLELSINEPISLNKYFALLRQYFCYILQ